MVGCISLVRCTRQVHSKYFVMGASLRPKGVAFPKDKPALVREEATRGELWGAKGCPAVWNWGQGSAGLSRECSLTKRTGRNSISIGWASEISCRDCGAPFDTRVSCATL